MTQEQITERILGILEILDYRIQYLESDDEGRGYDSEGKRAIEQLKVDMEESRQEA